MVGRTRLYQKTGSPLISGSSRRRSTPPWLGIALAVVAVAAAVAVYLTFLR
ncbi:MAG TPA: hypothetical protein VIL15_03195 [Coriobacteriia bacterium]